MTAAARPLMGAVSDRPLASVWARTVAAEWTRLWSVRSSWGLIAVASVMMTAIGVMAALGADTSSGGVVEAWAASTAAAMPVQMVLYALAVTAVTADYGSGGILATLQWTPDRRVLFLARAGVVVVTLTVVAAVLGLLPAVAARLVAPDHLTTSLGPGAQALGAVAGVICAGASVSVGVGFLLRSTAGALVATFLLFLVLPLFLLAPGNPALVAVGGVLPGSGAAYLLVDGGPPGMTATHAVAVLAGWGAVSLAAGWLRLARDDAHR